MLCGLSPISKPIFKDPHTLVATSKSEETTKTCGSLLLSNSDLPLCLGLAAVSGSVPEDRYYFQLRLKISASKWKVMSCTNLLYLGQWLPPSFEPVSFVLSASEGMLHYVLVHRCHWREHHLQTTTVRVSTLNCLEYDIVDVPLNQSLTSSGSDVAD